MGKIIRIVAIVVRGLMFAFRRLIKTSVGAIVFAFGLMIGVANYLVWLFPL